MLPRVLRACFELVSETIRLLPQVNLIEKPRLADYAEIGCAVSLALGKSAHEFELAFGSNIARQVQESVDASPLAVCLTHLTDLKRQLEGTPTELLKLIKVHANEIGIDLRSLPQTPRGFGKRLQEVRTSLEAIGYRVERGKLKNAGSG